MCRMDRNKSTAYDVDILYFMRLVSVQQTLTICSKIVDKLLVDILAILRDNIYV